MQSSDRNVLSVSQSRSDSAFHMPNTVWATSVGTAEVSIDMCQLRFRRRRAGCRRRPAHPQETPGALGPENVGRFAVADDRTPADQHQIDGVVVAVDHPGQAGVLLDGVLGVVLEVAV